MLSNEAINQPLKLRMQPIRQRADKNKLLIHEIYLSLQGESSHMGYPCVFIRTTGCHLRCSYCDTEQAFFKGQEMGIDEILAKVSSYKVKRVELTGGEPLLQSPSFMLLEKLADLDYLVLLETSGAVSIKNVDKRVRVILDVKTPSSLETAKNVWQNLSILWPGCEVKFVIASLDDYDFAKQICHRFDLFSKTKVLFSPVIKMIDPKTLAERMIEDKIDARFQMQLHRVLWGEESQR